MRIIIMALDNSGHIWSLSLWYIAPTFQLLIISRNTVQSFKAQELSCPCRMKKGPTPSSWGLSTGPIHPKHTVLKRTGLCTVWASGRFSGSNRTANNISKALLLGPNPASPTFLMATTTSSSPYRVILTPPSLHFSQSIYQYFCWLHLQNISSLPLTPPRIQPCSKPTIIAHLEYYNSLQTGLSDVDLAKMIDIIVPCILSI